MVVANDIEKQVRRPPGPRGAALGSLLRRPSLLAALAVLIIAVPTPGKTSGVSVATVTPADLVAVLLVAVMGLRVLAGDDLRVLRDKVMVAPVLMVAAAVVTTLWSTNPMLSLVGITRYAELFCLVPLAVVLAVRDKTDVFIVLSSLVALGAIQGVVGVYQALTGTGAGYQGETIRAVGTFGVAEPLAMSTIVAVTMVVLIAVALAGERRWRIPALVGTAALVAPLLFGLSRGALLGTIVTAVVMLLVTGLRRALAVLVIAGIVGLTGLTLLSGDSGTVTSRFTSIGSSATAPDRSVQDRYDLWAAAISIWRMSPITGVGIKQFPVYRDSHAPLALSSGSELATATTYTRGELLEPAQRVPAAPQRAGRRGPGRLRRARDVLDRASGPVAPASARRRQAPTLRRAAPLESRPARVVLGRDAVRRPGRERSGALRHLPGFAAAVGGQRPEPALGRPSTMKAAARNPPKAPPATTLTR